MTAPRCRPGDLAIVVSAPYTRAMLGRFVVVERLAVHGELLDGFPMMAPAKAGIIWVVRSAVDGEKLPSALLNGSTVHMSRRAFQDACMRPIRPNEGEDESLSWARPRADLEHSEGDAHAT